MTGSARDRGRCVPKLSRSGRRRHGIMTVATKEFQYAPPGVSGSPVPLRERYDNFIGGRWVAPVKGKYEVDLAPATGRAVHRGPALHCRGCRARARCGPRREGRLGRDVRDRARPRAQRHRRRDRRQQRDARRRRELGERQAGPRDARRRHPASRGPFPLLRQRHARAKRARSPSSTRTPSPTTSASRSASSVRSCRSTSRS